MLISEMRNKVTLSFRIFRKNQLKQRVMLDQIIQFAKEQMSNDVKSNHGLDDTQNNEVFSVAQSSIFESLKGQISNGNISDIMDLFNGKSDTDVNSNAVAGGVQQNVIQGLMDKFGFDGDKAGGIANSIVPSIIKRFADPETGNAADPADLVKKIGMDSDSGVADIIAKFTGDGGIGNLVKGMFDGK